MFLDCGRKSENPENMQTPHGNRWIAPVQQSERNSFSEERECLVVQISWQSIKIAGVSRSAGGKAGNIWIHLGDMNICTSLHGNPSNKLWNQRGRTTWPTSPWLQQIGYSLKLSSEIQSLMAIFKPREWMRSSPFMARATVFKKKKKRKSRDRRGNNSSLWKTCREIPSRRSFLPSFPPFPVN